MDEFRVTANDIRSLLTSFLVWLWLSPVFPKAQYTTQWHIGVKYTKDTSYTKRIITITHTHLGPLLTGVWGQAPARLVQRGPTPHVLRKGVQLLRIRLRRLDRLLTNVVEWYGKKQQDRVIRPSPVNLQKGVNVLCTFRIAHLPN